MSDRDAAIAFLRDVMDNTDVRMADRIKAAETIARIDTGAGAGDAGEVHAMSDAELLARARGDAPGEGGHPPREGPEAPRLSRDPSHARTEHPNAGGARTERPVTVCVGGMRIETPDPLAGRLDNGRDVPRETPRLLRRPADGTQNGPRGTQNEPANSGSIASVSGNGHSPEPWE